MRTVVPPSRDRVEKVLWLSRDLESPVLGVFESNSGGDNSHLGSKAAQVLWKDRKVRDRRGPTTDHQDEGSEVRSGGKVIERLPVASEDAAQGISQYQKV
jgi:hypothetical protein